NRAPRTSATATAWCSRAGTHMDGLSVPCIYLFDFLFRTPQRLRFAPAVSSSCCVWGPQRARFWLAWGYCGRDSAHSAFHPLFRNLRSFKTLSSITQLPNCLPRCRGLLLARQLLLRAHGLLLACRLRFSRSGGALFFAHHRGHLLAVLCALFR